MCTHTLIATHAPVCRRWGRNRALVAEELEQQRANTFFYAGLIITPQATDYTGRGGVYVHYKNASGYVVMRSGQDPRVNFAAVMQVRWALVT